MLPENVLWGEAFGDFFCFVTPVACTLQRQKILEIPTIAAEPRETCFPGLFCGPCG